MHTVRAAWAAKTTSMVFFPEGYYGAFLHLWIDSSYPSGLLQGKSWLLYEAMMTSLQSFALDTEADKWLKLFLVFAYFLVLMNQDLPIDKQKQLVKCH